MTTDSQKQYGRLMINANEYHRRALWQEKLRSLQEALAICEEPGFPDADATRQGLLYDVAGIFRRWGQYDRAKQTLQESLEAYPAATSSFKASVLGELGVMARHANRFLEAQNAFRDQGRLAREAPPSLEADAEICRAIGNEGMATYNLWQHTEPADPGVLQAAIDQIRERISRAQDLQQRLLGRNSTSKYAAMADAWEIIGMDRLTICLIAAGETEEALRVAEESQRKQKREDPTVTAFSKFFYGNALWHTGRRSDALREWNAPPGVCSSPMAFCKEPSWEHNAYLTLMSNAGVNFDSYDEQGFTALDHAVLGYSPDARDAIPIVEQALRNAFHRDMKREDPEITRENLDQKIAEEIATRRRQSELRRQYRTILQEHIRPELRTKDKDSASKLKAFKKLRQIYAKFLSGDTKERRMFSNFHYVKYTDFRDHGKLPISTSGLAKQFFYDTTVTKTTAADEEFIIFFSYRWTGVSTPDNDENSQWRRMILAVEEFLKMNPEVHESTIGLWVDYACIDQSNSIEQERGVDALPLAVTQCNAMISLVDETYFERAWCVVEVMLMRALMESYGLHEWWECSREGALRKGDVTRVFDVKELKLTKEKLDRPKIDFLFRQSKLLGRDEA